MSEQRKDSRRHFWEGPKYEQNPEVPRHPPEAVEVIEDHLHAAECELEQLDAPFMRAFLGPALTTVSVFIAVFGMMVRPTDPLDQVTIAPLLVALGVFALLIIWEAKGRDRRLARVKNEIRCLKRELGRAKSPTTAEGPAAEVPSQKSATREAPPRGEHSPSTRAAEPSGVDPRRASPAVRRPRQPPN